MKGLDKLTYPRLAEALIQTGSVDPKVIRELLKEAESTGQAMPELLIREELFSEWDLVRLVSDHFTLPIVYPLQYEVDGGLLSKLDMETLRTKNILPLSKFGDVLAVAMPIFTPISSLQELERQHKVEIFPYVAPISENSQILLDHGSRPGTQNQAIMESGWEKLFDEAEATIQDSALSGFGD